MISSMDVNADVLFSVYSARRCVCVCVCLRIAGVNMTSLPTFLVHNSIDMPLFFSTSLSWNHLVQLWFNWLDGAKSVYQARPHVRLPSNTHWSAGRVGGQHFWVSSTVACSSSGQVVHWLIQLCSAISSYRSATTGFAPTTVNQPSCSTPNLHFALGRPRTTYNGL